jgi:hypothetical protein
MALYSTWDWDRNAWRVYTTRAPVSVGDDPIPPRPTGISALGADPDTHVKPLPSGARFVGYSHVARGEVRRLGGVLGAVGDDAGRAGVMSNGWLMFGLGVAAASTFWWWRRRR